ncbi:ankyrin repeat domain-containing protein [Acerihabitans sp. KWT182]|uniref:Ankyrin repeat domain-containing protein n=1 Tax=Acerihabitans sp. KWT182 TaxID=3157919 RepID=A0AAU7QD26_9GAMM
MSTKLTKKKNTAVMWLVKNQFYQKNETYFINNLRILDYLRDHNANYDFKGTAGYTPLMISVLGKDHRTFFRLLLEGAQYDHKNDAGETALHLSIKYETHWMISVVLRYGAENDDIKDNNGHTPFMLATFRENKEIMDFYIRRGGLVLTWWIIRTGPC